MCCQAHTTRGSAILCPLPVPGSPLPGPFSTASYGRRAGGLPGVRHTPSPYPVPLQCTAATTVGYRGSLSHVCSPPSAHPSSGFAVRYVHGFCLRLLSVTPFLDMPLPLLGVPSVCCKRHRRRHNAGTSSHAP